MNTKELIQQFIQHLMSQKNPAAKVTAKNYAADVHKFTSWYEETYNRSFKPEYISSQIADQFKEYILKTASASSAQRYLSSLRKFSTYLREEGLISENPFQSPASVQSLDPWHIKDFKNNLYIYNASPLTIKNYIIDTKQFLAWATQITGVENEWDMKEKDLLKKIDVKLIENYKDQMLASGLSPASINRKLSSIRKYTSWAQSENLMGGFTQMPERIHADNIRENQFINPRESITTEASTEPLNANYSSFAPVRLGQKITKGVAWVFDSTIVAHSANIVEHIEFLLFKLGIKKIFTDKKRVIADSIRGNLFTNPRISFSNIKKEVYAPDKISLAALPLHRRIIHHARHTRPSWYHRYHSYPITSYFHFAILIIVMSALGVAYYRAFVEDPSLKNPALAAAVPTRILSFQGRLTDTSDNPITSQKWMRFILYNSETATAAAGVAPHLWEEVRVATPDADGIFNVLLGAGPTGSNAPTCGVFPATGPCGIPQSVFRDNDRVWLGVTVESDPELAPRQQIATVAYATNAEVLQGLPPTTDTGVTTNTNVVLALNGSGTLNIGGVTATTFQSTGGQFNITGKVLRLATTDASDIQLAPDGIGKIDAQKPITNTTLNNNIQSAAGSVEIDDLFSVRATSAAQAGFTLVQDGAGPIFTASAGATTKFLIENGGDVGIGTTDPGFKLEVIGTTRSTGGGFYATQSSPTDTLIIDNLSAGSARIITNSSNPLALGVNSSTTQLVLENGGNVGIGTTDPSSNLDVRGAAGASGYIEIDAPSNFDAGLILRNNNAAGWQINNQGVATTNDLRFYNYTTAATAMTILASNSNLGIGTTAPAQKLDVAGSATISATLSLGPMLQVDAGTCNAAAAGKMYYDAPNTSYYYCNGTTWTQMGSGAGGGGSNWRFNLGTLSPINDTVDLLVGANSSASAKFAVLNVSSGTPVASVSSGLNGTAAFLTADGYLQTEKRGTLNIGGAKTGDIVFRPGTALDSTAPTVTFATGGNVGIGTITPAYKLDINPTSGVSDYLGRIYNQSTNAAAAGLSIRIDGNGNLLQLNSSGSDIVTISPTQSTFNNPVNFTSPGDVSIAYDIVFTNPTASYIKSAAPLTIQAGETYNSSNLNLATYNKGNVVVDSEAFVTNYAATVSSQLVVGTAVAPANIGGLHVTNTNVLNGGTLSIASISGQTSFAAMVVDNKGVGDIFTASSSGLPRFTIKEGGDIYIDQGVSLFSTDVSDGTVEATKFCTGDGETNCVTDFSAIVAGSGYWTRTTGNLYPTNLNDTISATTSAAVALTLTQTGAFNALLVEDQASDTSPFVIDQSGSVGIGTTAPGYALTVKTSSSNTQIAVGSSTSDEGGYLISTAGHQLIESGGASWNGSNFVARNALSSQVRQASGLLTFFTDSGLTPGNTFTPSERMRIDLSGNVGIGTTAPLQPLTVGPTTTTAIHLGQTDAASGTWIRNNGSDVVFSTNVVGDMYYGYLAPNAVDHRFGASAPNPTLFVQGISGGNVGIGTTTPTSFKLQVTGSVGPTTTDLYDLGSSSLRWANVFTNFANFSRGATISAQIASDIPLQVNDNSGNSIFQVSNTQITNALPAQFTAAGDVSIAYDLLFTNQTASFVKSNGPLTIQAGEIFESNDLTLQATNSGNIVLDVNSSGNILAAPYGGNVGIGTTTPANQLHVYKTGLTGVGNTSATVRIGEGSTGDIAYMGMVDTPGAGNPYFFLQAETIGTAYRDIALGPLGGNVGIGTTSPNVGLTVVDGTSAVPIQIGDMNCTATNFTGIAFGALTGSCDDYSLLGNNSDTLLNAPGSGDILFRIGNVSAAIIDQDGDLGIGTTNPTFTIDAQRTSADSTVNIQSNTSGNAVLQLLTNGNQEYEILANRSSNRLEISRPGAAGVMMAFEPNAGNVGIGTTGGEHKLHVNGDSGGKSLVLINSTTTNQNIMVASNSGTTRFKLSRLGEIYGTKFIDLDNAADTYYLDPHSTGTSLNVAGAGVFAGDVTLGDAAGTDLTVGGGAGKINVGTVDPPYTINGVQYATYMPAMTGVKEETTGNVQTSDYVAGLGYKYTIDFTNLPIASDLWLFSKATNIGENLESIVPLLTPSDNTRVWYTIDEDNYRLNLYSGRPTTISYRLTAPRFDSYNHSNIRENDPMSPGFVVEDGDELQILNPSGNLEEDTILSINSLQIVEDTNSPDPAFRILNQAGETVSDFGSFSDALIANLTAGYINAQEIVSDTLQIDAELTSPLASINRVRTNIISPLASDIVVIEGKLTVQNRIIADSLQINTDASISGNLLAQSATISGNITAQDASISGDLAADTIRANRIIANSIEGLEATIATITANQILASSNLASSSGTTTPTFSGVESINPSIRADSIVTDFISAASLSGQLASIEAISSEQLDLSGNLTATFGTFQQGLVALGPTSLADVSIAGQLAIGASMILADNSINVLGADLEIQPLQQGGVSFLSGLVRIDTDGNLNVEGNATFANNVRVDGTLSTDIVSPLPGNDLTLSLGEGVQSSKFKVQNASGSGVFEFDQEGNLAASGSGNFADILANTFKIVRTAQADTSLTTTIATSSAGTATIVVGETERTIITPFVKEGSLIYLSPASNTKGEIPYVARQTVETSAPGTEGSFTIQIPKTLNINISVNWWIIN